MPDSCLAPLGLAYAIQNLLLQFCQGSKNLGDIYPGLRHYFVVSSPWAIVILPLRGFRLNLINIPQSSPSAHQFQLNAA